MSLHKRLLAILACPACRAKLEEKCGSLVCASCGKAYAVKDGIPRLIV